MILPINFPESIDAKIFVRDYWQQKPLFIKNALPDFTDPLTAEELAGLACEEGIASRLILERGDSPWQVRHGPFNEKDFTSLPESHYTFLVQDLNRYIPELNQLLDSFNFLPAWRIDDVMVSYAAPHGTVGPHTDQYDVFLLQGLGTRRWQINTQADARNEKLIPDLDLRILAEFAAEEEFFMQAGDMLYLPPGVQHHGISDAACMTYSVGFRAATQLELLGDYIDQRTLHSCDEVRFRDGGIEADTHNGEIKPAARQRVRDMIKQIPGSDAEIDDWFGRFITYTGIHLNTGIPLTPTGEAAVFVSTLQTQGPLLRDSQSRFAYIEMSQGLQLYIDGESLPVPASLAELVRLLCDCRQYDEAMLSPYLQRPEHLGLLCAWWETGLVYFDD
ncbi:cupin domain-containing protein [Sulfuriflexus mobilis]|uniref:cupin domain-containing protein n=1 Tax=Sulfuriflexus mobilis TaxID=1811807 RepID=UPI00155A030A|nr:cupin domain-containing protein [Sulfuriflexus mobilis]